MLSIRYNLDSITPTHTYSINDYRAVIYSRFTEIVLFWSSLILKFLEVDWKIIDDQILDLKT